MGVKKVPLARVRPGAVLAENVQVRGQSQVLLSRGTELDSSHLETLSRQGVDIITVEDQDSEGQDTEAPKLEGDELRRLVVQQHKWFGDTRENPVMAELFRCVVNRAARGGK